MAPPEFRFRPPLVALDAEVEWVFKRAFGPVARPVSLVGDPHRVLEMARRFDLAARLGAHVGHETLVGELGREVAEELFLPHVSAKAEGVRLARTASLLGRVSAELSLPLVFLKYQALSDLGVVSAGSRFACDVDLLVPSTRAHEVAAKLTELGYEAADYPPSEHQLSIMFSPTLSPVEVHHLIPGVSLADHTNAATFEDLQRVGSLIPLDRHLGQCYAPDRPVLVAHVISHGIAQHGSRPSAYSMTRMLADLIDLGVCEAGGETLMESARPLMARSVSPQEARAAVDLCRRLSQGDLDVERQDPGREVLLLRHILAGELDPAYAASLRLRIHRRGLSDTPLPLALAKQLVRMVFKTRAELDGIYGPPKSRLGALRRRLWRPFDLLYRLVRYSAQHVALKLKSRPRGTRPRSGQGREAD